MIRRRATTGAGPLSAGVVAVLLAGWDMLRQIADDDPDRNELFTLYQGREPAVAALWRTHASFLVSEATRLDIERRRWGHDRVERFYGEHVAAHADDDPAA